MTVSEAILSIMMAVITLISAFGAKVAIPYLQVLVESAKSRMSEEQLVRARLIAGVAVNAAEQMWKGGDGERKLRDAMARADVLAQQHGIDLDDGDWRSLIEAAVKEMNDLRDALSNTTGTPTTLTFPGNHEMVEFHPG